MTQPNAIANRGFDYNTYRNGFKTPNIPAPITQTTYKKINMNTVKAKVIQKLIKHGIPTNNAYDFICKCDRLKGLKLSDTIKMTAYGKVSGQLLSGKLKISQSNMWIKISESIFESARELHISCFLENKMPVKEQENVIRSIYSSIAKNR